jgi:hypothetical protein
VPATQLRIGRPCAAPLNSTLGLSLLASISHRSAWQFVGVPSGVRHPHRLAIPRRRRTLESVCLTIRIRVASLNLYEDRALSTFFGEASRANHLGCTPFARACQSAILPVSLAWPVCSKGALVVSPKTVACSTSSPNLPVEGTPCRPRSFAPNVRARRPSPTRWVSL